MHYCQITSAIPAWLKNQVSINNYLQQLSSLHRNFDNQLSKDITFDLKKIKCKQFYELFIETIDRVPTAMKSWRKKKTQIAEQWVPCIGRSYEITGDNKLRQFNFKLLHRILVSNKELKYCDLANCEKCLRCDKLDSIIYAFLECQPFLNLCERSIQWFNDLHKTNVNLTPLQIFFNFSTPASNLSNNHINDLSILLLHSKQCYYAWKTMQKKVDISEFIS